MICPNCQKDGLFHQSDFTYDECGYEGEGLVSYYECMICGAQVEVCVPDETDSEVLHGQAESD